MTVTDSSDNNSNSFVLREREGELERIAFQGLSTHENVLKSNTPFYSK